MLLVADDDEDDEEDHSQLERVSGNQSELTIEEGNERDLKFKEFLRLSTDCIIYKKKSMYPSEYCHMTRMRFERDEP